MSMTLEEAIKHAEEVAEENEKEFRLCPYPSQECNGSQDCRCLENGEGKGCLRCAAEHRQLAEWLRELQERRKRPEPKWIPVNEELPDVGQSVLLSTTRGHALAGYRLEPSSLYLVTDDEDGKEMWVYDPDSYTDTYGDAANDLPRSEDCGFSDMADSYSLLAVTSPNYDARFQGVTAWMPMPKPYKEGAE